MKTLAVLARLLELLAGLLIFKVTDTKATTANNKLASEVGEANNSSASAVITITMTAVSLPDE